MGYGFGGLLVGSDLLLSLYYLADSYVRNIPPGLQPFNDGHPHIRFRIYTKHVCGSDPLERTIVKSFWADHTVEPSFVLHRDVRVTNEQGQVIFPPRKIFTTLLFRGVGNALSKIDLWSPASYGRTSSVHVDGYYQTLRYHEGEELPRTLILRRD